MLVTRGDGYVTGPQAAQLARVTPATIRKWRQRGHLAPRGLDERGHPLYHPDDVAAAEKRVTENGLRTSGINPRALRGRAPGGRLMLRRIPREVWQTITESLADLHRKVDKIMTAQDDINAAVTALQNEVTGVAATATDLAAAAANIQAEIAALQAGNPGVNTSALNAAVAALAPVQQQLATAQSAVNALETPAAPPTDGTDGTAPAPPPVSG